MELEQEEEIIQPGHSLASNSLLLCPTSDEKIEPSSREEQKTTFLHEKHSTLHRQTHPEDTPSPVVFVRSLPPAATERDIERVCSKFGVVKQVCLLLMGSSAKPQAFVEFEVSPNSLTQLRTKRAQRSASIRTPTWALARSCSVRGYSSRSADERK